MTVDNGNKMYPPVLYQDDDLLIINKTPGLLSVPDGYDPNLPHLRSILEPHFGKLWMVHRLDKETSGVILLAKNEQAHRMLNAQFRERNIKKYYHGLVTPVPDWREMNTELPLQPDADRKHRTRVSHKFGKDAQTNFKVEKRFSLGVLMNIQTLTGITHQIRAHLRAFDLILFGESLYNAGLPEPPFQTSRMMLHALTIAFTHPSTGSREQFTAPYPEDFRDAYTKLKATRTLDVMT